VPATQPFKRRPTDAQVRDLPHAREGQRFIRLPNAVGLYLVVGKTAKTFVHQREVRRLGERKTVRITLGRFPELSVQDAYDRVHEESKAKADALPSRGPTLREAFERFKVAHLERQRRSPRTIEQYDYTIGQLLACWANTPLRDLAEDPARVAQKHDELTRANGAYAANHAMRCLRAVYRHARKANPKLPADHPAVAVDYNAEERKDNALSREELRAWWAKWTQIGNPVRRELHVLSLLSAMRRDALQCARWEHLRVAERVLHVPLPKGGAKRAFDLPLSRGMLASLARLRRACEVYADGTPWLFPSRTAASGHVTEVKQSKKLALATGHALRATWITQARALGLPSYHTKILANHKTDNDVHDGYASARALKREMREVQEQMSRHLLSLAPREARELLRLPRAARPKRA
jgi:hypothetical protein